MLQTVSISSKRQITIPAKVYGKLGLKQGEKMVVRSKGGTLTMQKASGVLESLAKSVILPKRFVELDTSEIVSKAKKEYFSDIK